MLIDGFLGCKDKQNIWNGQGFLKKNMNLVFMEHKSYLKSEIKSFGELAPGDKKEHKSYLKSGIKSFGELVLGG